MWHALQKLNIETGYPQYFTKDQRLPQKIVLRKDTSSINPTGKILAQTPNEEKVLSSPKRPKLDCNKYCHAINNYPKFSVGYYLNEIPKPASMSWSFEEVSNNLTSEGLSKMFHELAPFLPINPIDELLERFEYGVAEVKKLFLRNMKHLHIF